MQPPRCFRARWRRLHVEGLERLRGRRCGWQLQEPQARGAGGHPDAIADIGQTEACGFTTLNPIVGIRKKESVGVPISNIWVKIVDDNFAELPPGKVGEILQKDCIKRHYSCPLFVLLLAWNFADAILEAQRPWRDLGGQFLIPVPEPILK